MPIRVEVRLLGAFRRLASVDRLSLEGESSNVKSVVRILADLLPMEAKRLLIDPDLDDPRPNALVLLNGREISVLNGLDSEVSDGDVITLIPVAHGG